MTGDAGKVKVNIPVCLAAVLLCLTLISIRMTSGLYARYISSASGSDAARVITFGDLTVTETGDFYEDNKLMIIPGVDIAKKATVNFAGSESATYVFLEIDANGWITTDHSRFTAAGGDLYWNVEGGWNFLKADSETYVYYRELTPNTQLTADIIANGLITVSRNLTREDIRNLPALSIGLRAAAVQSGGFANPEAAWNSIAAKGEN